MDDRNPFIDLAEQNRALSARASELEAVIHRLRPSNRPPGCWCAPFWDTQRYGHDETCQAVSALLREQKDAR